MLKLLGFVPEPLEHWQRVRLHIGTSDVLTRVSLLDEKNLRPGQTAPVQLVLEEPVVASLGQRFVIRFYSPLRTIGGGEVLVPYASRPSGRKRRESERDRLVALSGTLTREERVGAIVNFEGSLSMSELMVQAQERRQDLAAVLEKLESGGKLVRLHVGDGMIFSAESYRNAVEKLRAAAKAFHAAYPHQRGIAPESLINQVFSESERKIGRLSLEKAVEQSRFRVDGDVLALPKFAAVDDSAYSEARKKLLDHCSRCGFQLPEIEALPKNLNMTAGDFRKLLDQLKKNNEVVVLEGTFVLAVEILNPLLARLSRIEGGFTLAQVRDLTGSSRKFVLPVLEYMDGRGITRRVGEKRILLKKD